VKQAGKVVWCQEEPRNMGAWSFVEPLLEEVLTEVGGAARRAVFAGRVAAASPATGLLTKHQAEQAALLDAALAG
jgi:2-oxoglutarate dehydrogenase E1 component